MPINLKVKKNIEERMVDQAKESARILVINDGQSLLESRQSLLESYGGLVTGSRLSASNPVLDWRYQALPQIDLP